MCCYGYVARAAAGPAEELTYIEEVRRQDYGAIDMHVPVSNDDALARGMDLTLTLVFLNRDGKVALHHLGRTAREELEPPSKRWSAALTTHLATFTEEKRLMPSSADRRLQKVSCRTFFP